MKQNNKNTGLENSIEQCKTNKQLEEVCKMENQNIKHEACNDIIREFRADFISVSNGNLHEIPHEDVLPHENIIEEKLISFMRKHESNLAG